MVLIIKELIHQYKNQYACLCLVSVDVAVSLIGDNIFIWQRNCSDVCGRSSYTRG